jgi:hypothetical protein
MDHSRLQALSYVCFTERQKLNKQKQKQQQQQKTHRPKPIRVLKPQYVPVRVKAYKGQWQWRPHNPQQVRRTVSNDQNQPQQGYWQWQRQEEQEDQVVWQCKWT